VEVVHGDTPALMYLFHRCTGVGVRAAERRGEELDLLPAQPGHIRSGEETGELVVGEDSGIEIGDDGFQSLVSADPFEDGGGGRCLLAERRYPHAPSTPGRYYPAIRPESQL